MRCSFAILAAALLLACASAPPAPAPGRAGAFGYLKLVPREGVVPASGGSHAYGDREFEGVAFVDYSKPGFAVVYADAATAEHAPAGAGNRIGPAAASRSRALVEKNRRVERSAARSTHDEI